jgi:hypothetical protein
MHLHAVGKRDAGLAGREAGHPQHEDDGATPVNVPGNGVPACYRVVVLGLQEANTPRSDLLPHNS